MDPFKLHQFHKKQNILFWQMVLTLVLVFPWSLICAYGEDIAKAQPSDSSKALSLEPVQFDGGQEPPILGPQKNDQNLAIPPKIVSTLSRSEQNPQQTKTFKLIELKTRSIYPLKLTASSSLPYYPGFLHFMKGEPAQDTIYSGMLSHHLVDGMHYREVNNLLGVQYHGLFAATFANSYSQQTVVAGIARTIYKADLFKKFQYTLGYKLGPMYGYHTKGVPTIDRFTVLPMAVNSINYKMIGVDLNLVPGNVISFGLHFNRYLK